MESVDLEPTVLTRIMTMGGTYVLEEPLTLAMGQVIELVMRGSGLALEVLDTKRNVVARSLLHPEGRPLPMTEARAREILGFEDELAAKDFRPGDTLKGRHGNTFDWLKRGQASLSGNFDPEVLEAIAWWMRNKKVTT